MSQTQNNQASPVNTGPNLSVPPQVGAFSPGQENGQPGTQQGGSNNSPAPPGQSQLPRPLITYVPGMNNRRYSYQFDDKSEKENPCCCCCGLGASVKYIVILNLVYLFLKFSFFLPIEKLGGGGAVAWFAVLIVLEIVTFPLPKTDRSFGWGSSSTGDPSCFVLPVPVVYYTVFGAGMVVFLIYLMDVITTIMFMRVAFCKPGVDEPVFFCNVFMWNNLFYPGIILHLAVYIGARSKYCDTNWTLPYWILGFLGLIAWVVCNALVARAYRNGIIRRESFVDGQGPALGPQRSTAGVNAARANGRELEEAPV